MILGAMRPLAQGIGYSYEYPAITPTSGVSK